MTEKEVSELLQRIWPGWRVTQNLGAGAYGQVYKIEKHDYSGVFTAALKLIKVPGEKNNFGIDDGMYTDVQITQFYASVVNKLVQEFKVMAMFKGNSNIVSYEEHYVEKSEDGKSWLILIRMEFLTPLIRQIAVKGLSRQELIKLGIDICSALELCQKKNVIHRDIKPANIFVSEFGDYKLGDFGVAKTIENAKGNLSRQGTYNYMAPEVYRDNSDYDGTVDIYSLGMVLYQYMNNGRGPFLGEEITPDTQNESLIRRMSGESFNMPANESGPLAQIALKACSFDPGKRYRSPLDMKRDLMMLLDDSDTIRFFLPSVSAQNTANVSVPSSMNEPTPVSIRVNTATGASVRNTKNPSVTNSVNTGKLNFMDGTYIPSFVPEVQVVRIRFMDEHGGVFAEDPYNYGSIIVIPEISDYEADGMHYSFRGWAPQVEPKALADADYVAVFEAVPLFATPVGEENAEPESKGSGSTGRKKLIPVISAAAILVIAAVLIFGGKGKKPAEPVAELPQGTEVVSVEETQENSPALVEEEPVTVEEEPEPVEELTYDRYLEIAQWSDWNEKLPEEINSDAFIIEKRDVFRSTPMHEISKKNADENSIVRYGKWKKGTTWIDSKPKQNNTSRIGSTRTVYAYKEVVGTIEVGDEGHMHTKIEYKWSDVKYTTTKPQEAANKLKIVSSVTQYTQDTRDVKYYAADDSAWSEWGEERVLADDDTAVENKTLYRWTERPSELVVSEGLENYSGYASGTRETYADIAEDSQYWDSDIDYFAPAVAIGALKPDDRMNIFPAGSVSAGEGIKSAVILKRIYEGIPGLVAEETNVDSYAEYAASNGFDLASVPEITAEITLAQYAHILSCILPDAVLEKKCEIDADGALDVISDNEFASDIQILAEAEIISIPEKPDELCTRGYMASIIREIINAAAQ